MEERKSYISGTMISVGLDVLEISDYISKKNRKYQAILLHDIEETMGKNSKEFPIVRKLVLDAFNNYTRAMMRVIFGSDLEI